MVLPEDLLTAIKHRAREQGLSVTAYISALVREDLALCETDAAAKFTNRTDPSALLFEIEQLRQRVNDLEKRLPAP